MNGELAQVIALVAHGNYFVNHEEISKIDLSGNSTFKFVNEVKFVRYKNTMDKQGVEVAGNVTDWFDNLRSNHVKRLWNIGFAWDRSDFAEHIAVAFSGGVPIAIQLDLPEGFELWYPLWKTGGQPQKPWFVEYRGLVFNYSHAAEMMDLKDVKEKLRVSISMAEEFSNRPGVDLKGWGEEFSKALGLLESATVVAPYHPDMLPVAGFSTEARQILAVAAQAYVFGGMGSWNDLGFENLELQKEYGEVTKILYQAVKMSILMASNSYVA
jgi:hypothetical protein